jgi:hypothetical protein
LLKFSLSKKGFFMKGGTPTMKNKIIITSCIAVLAVVAGWNWYQVKFGEKCNNACTGTPSAMNDSLINEGETLASMAGQPIVSAKSLERDFDQLLEENPQLKSVLPLMPDAKYNFLQGMVSQAVVDHYVAENKIDEQEEYKKDLARMERSFKRMLNTKYFGMQHPVEVTDAEIEKFYGENKDTMPDLLLSRGGVKAMGISFSSEEQARAFATKAKGKDFARVAREAGMTDKIRDFKFVNAQSIGMDTAVKNRVVSMTKFPAVEVVKGDDKKATWVVNATEMQDPKYRPLEQVKAGLKQFIEKEKRMAALDKEITKLKDEYKVVVNEEFFKPQKESQVAEQQGASEAQTATPASQAA